MKKVRDWRKVKMAQKWHHHSEDVEEEGAGEEAVEEGTGTPGIVMNNILATLQHVLHLILL